MLPDKGTVSYNFSKVTPKISFKNNKECGVFHNSHVIRVHI